MNDTHSIPATDPRHFWCDLGLHLRIEGPEGSREVKTDQPFARIGGHKDSEVVLEGERVRRRHLILIAFTNGIYCIDLIASAKNGKQTGSWLDSEIPLKVGAFVIHAHAVTPQGEQISVRPQNTENFRLTLELDPPRLEVVRRGEPVGRFLLRKQFTCFGRSPGNRIWVRSQYLSQFHLLFVRDETGLWLIDLLSANKPIVNGHPQEFGPLHGPSARILVGTLMLKLTNLPEAKRPGREKGPELRASRREKKSCPLPDEISVPVKESIPSLETGFDSVPEGDELDETSLSVLVFNEGITPRVTAVKANDSLADLLMQLSEAKSALDSERSLVIELREHVGKHAEQESRLEQRIADLERQLNLKDSEIGRRASALESSQLNLESARKELGETLVRIESLRADAEAATHLLQEERRIRAENDRELEELRSQVQSLESGIEARHGNRRDENEEKIRRLEIQLLDQAAKTEQEKARNDVILRKTEEKVHWLEQQCLELTSTIESGESRIHLLQNDARQEEKRIRAEHERELAEIRSQLLAQESAHQSRLNSLNEEHHQKVSQLKKQLRDRAEELEQEKARIDRIRTESDEKVRILEQKHAELSAAIEANNSRAMAIPTGAEEEIRRLQHQYAELDTRFNNEKSRCTFLQEEVENLRQELSARADADRIRIEEAQSVADRTADDAASLSLATMNQLAEKEKQLETMAEEIKLAKEQLERARTAFERELAAGGSQLMVLMNLDRDRRERSWWHRVLHSWRKKPGTDESS